MTSNTKIEEKVREFEDKWNLLDTRGGFLLTFTERSKHKIKDWLRTILTELLNAALDEAIKKVQNRHGDEETHSVCNKHNIGGKSVCCECSGKSDCSNN